ncbi:MAG: lipid A deacylase LpxR family protein, partial [Bacteroidales bacterium]|nr:lipid A deacylase LpxR family protein [Bacteroidales bacterium]
MKRFFWALVAVAALRVAPLALAGPEVPEPEAPLPSRGGTLSLIYENDAFSNSDGHYTSGVRLSWIPGSADTPRWAEDIARRIPGFPREGQVLHGYSFGQNMYTPTDIEVEDPPRDERPYAGWLYATIGLAAETGRQLDQVVLTVGIVGPASLAEKTQKLVHKLVDSDEPRGWDTQLRNEPGIMLGWQRNWRAWMATNLWGNQLDISPHLGATVGNIYT